MGPSFEGIVRKVAVALTFACVFVAQEPNLFGCSLIRFGIGLSLSGIHQAAELVHTQSKQCYRSRGSWVPRLAEPRWLPSLQDLPRRRPRPSPPNEPHPQPATQALPSVLLAPAAVVSLRFPLPPLPPQSPAAPTPEGLELTHPCRQISCSSSGETAHRILTCEAELLLHQLFEKRDLKSAPAET